MLKKGVCSLPLDQPAQVASRKRQPLPPRQPCTASNVEEGNGGWELGFPRGSGLELDFKGIEQMIIWMGIMYYRANLEAAPHWLPAWQFYLLRMSE